jgi:hypothetical protein
MLVEHDEIRRWAEERSATPSRVKDTARGSDDVGIIRLDFPGYSGEGSLEQITWEEWFEEFDKRNLALIVQGQTAGGQASNFNKLVSRGSVGESGRSRGRGRRKGATASSRAKSRGRETNKSTAKSTRGSTRAKRTQSVRGRTTSRRKAA